MSVALRGLSRTGLQAPRGRPPPRESAKLIDIFGGANTPDIEAITFAKAAGTPVDLKL